MADAAGNLLGGFGVAAVALAAMFALTSMANAGVMGTSRFLLAMSRDSLLPEPLSHIDSRFLTPRNAVVVTGLALLTLIAFVPVVDLAKLASAFLIVVFSIENVALIAFRVADLDSYDPAFRSPGYPYIQVFGLLAGAALLTQMGTLPILGATGITVGGLVIYLIYGRPRTDRTGVVGTIIRRRSGEEREAVVEQD